MVEQLLEAIVEQLSIANKKKRWRFKKIEEHAGSFAWKELEEKGYNAPALFVSNLGWKPLANEQDSMSSSMGDIYEARFLMALITEHKGGFEKQNKQARQLAQVLVKFLEDNCFGFDEISEAYRIKADPVFSGAFNENGQSLWLIEFWHQLPMAADTVLDNFEGLDGQHNNPQNPTQTLAKTTIDFTEK